ncbi:MAG TPA: substrate-binding domain-containing protein, partial [Ktedonobacteraceae bacterium]
FIALGRYYSLEDDGSTGDGYKFMKQFLQKTDQFTAVFASCDILATGVLQAIYEYDLKVPTDISVVGFDNTYGPYLTPPLTTVELPMMDIGRSAVRIVLENHYRKATSPALETTHQHTRLSTRLIVRASTGAPRTARMAAKE